MLSLSSLAKKESKETNIVCFAANKQWVCAPEGKEELANQKAKQLLEDNSGTDMSDIVIKTINIPKFDSPKSENPNTLNQKQDNLIAQSPIVNDAIKIKKQDSTKKIQSTELTENPYSKLWSHQLIGVSTPQNAINYVKKNRLSKEDVLIIKSERKGMDWWIVLYGLYKDKQTGLENEANLPIKSQSWLRPLKNLQVNGFIEKY